jgi:hypothetical protein
LILSVQNFTQWNSHTLQRILITNFNVVVGFLPLTILLEIYLQHLLSSLNWSKCKQSYFLVVFVTLNYVLCIVVHVKIKWHFFVCCYLLPSNNSRLGDNQFSGTLPDFIQSWTGLQRLYEPFLSCCDNWNNHFFFLVELHIINWLIKKKNSNCDRVMQASGLSGPVPSGISYLKNLTDL